MIRKDKTYEVDEILQLIDSNKMRIDLDGDPIRVSSLRLRTFKKGITCARCGLAGSRFYKEKAHDTQFYHLNMYGVKGDEEILMTHDHIKPRSRGGPDHIDNTQTMCLPCNMTKADSYDGKN